MNGEDPTLGQLVKGQIKWFDPAKGVGFLADTGGGPDALLHANVLRNFGQSSVVEGALVEVREHCPAEFERDNLRMQLEHAREAFREELDLLRQSSQALRASMA